MNQLIEIEKKLNKLILDFLGITGSIKRPKKSIGNEIDAKIFALKTRGKNAKKSIMNKEPG